MQELELPSEQQDKIFKPYYQVSNKKTSLQGMGLGLPIVKKVIENLGGEISIESKPAKASGTKIIITLDRLYFNRAPIPVLEASTESNVSSMHMLEDYNVHDSLFLPQKRSIFTCRRQQGDDPFSVQ